MEEKKITVFFKNAIYAIGAQIVSFLATFVVSFIAPKIIDVSNFAFWQLFLFYVTYINITRLGLLDGMYLRFGGRKYHDLNHKLLGNEWLYFVIFQVIISSLLFFFIMISNMTSDRKFVFGMCCLCMIIINSNNFFGFIFQSVNQTKKYSVSVILQNITWFFAVAIIYIFKIYSYKVIIICYVLGHVCAGIYLAYHSKKIWKVKKYPVKPVLIDISKNIKCGIFLMVSLYAGNLIIGGSRIIVDSTLGIEAFGFFSFSLTLANFFLTFISQISMVLFPTLKELDEKKQISMFSFICNSLNIVLPIILLGYLPTNFLIKLWLPQYEVSLKYLLFFLPICIYDGKMQLLCSTYFKVLRQEKIFMFINISSMIISAFLSFIGCFFAKKIEFVAMSILFVIALRSIVSEIILSNLLKKKKGLNFVLINFMVIFFIVVTINTNAIISFFAYVLVYLVYLSFNKNFLKQMLISFIKRKKEV